MMAILSLVFKCSFSAECPQNKTARNIGLSFFRSALGCTTVGNVVILRGLRLHHVSNSRIEKTTNSKQCELVIGWIAICRHETSFELIAYCQKILRIRLTR